MSLFVLIRHDGLISVCSATDSHETHPQCGDIESSERERCDDVEFIQFLYCLLIYMFIFIFLCICIYENDV